MAILLEFHQIQYADQKPTLSCDICDGLFYTKFQIQNHMIEWHSGKKKNLSHQCGTCGKSFYSSHNLKIHTEKVHEQGEIDEFECYMCQVKLKSLYQTRQHIKFAHQRNEHCQVCLMYFTTQEMSEHLCDGLSGCTVCHQTFKTTPDLLHHLDNDCKHEKLLYKCDICAKFFAMELIKDVHMKRHVKKVKKFSCDLCPNNFESYVGLYCHKKTHEKEPGRLHNECNKWLQHF